MNQILKMELINQGTEAEIRLIGRITSNNAPELQRMLEDQAERFDRIVIDLRELEYISSAGLRALKILYVKMKDKGGQVVIRGVCEDVRNMFNVTGFSKLFTFED